MAKILEKSGLKAGLRLLLSSATLAGLSIAADASPVLLRGAATPRPLTVDGLTFLLQSKVPPRLAAEFLAEPELRGAWLEFRRSRGGSAPASEFLARVASLPGFRKAMARLGPDPEFQRAFSEVARDPRLAPLAREIRSVRAARAPAPRLVVDERRNLFLMMPKEARAKLEAVCVEHGCADMVRACREAGVAEECLAALNARQGASPAADLQDPASPSPSPRLLRGGAAPLVQALPVKGDDATLAKPAASSWETAGRGLGSLIGKTLGDFIGRLAGDLKLGDAWAKSGGDMGARIGKNVADALATAAKTFIETLGALIGGALAK